MGKADLEMVLDPNGTQVQLSIDFKKDAYCKVQLAMKAMELMPNLREVTLKGCNIDPFLNVNCAPPKSCPIINLFWIELLSKVNNLNIESDCQVAYGKMSEFNVWSRMATLFRKHLNSEDTNLQMVNLNNIFPAISLPGCLSCPVSSRNQFGIVGKIHLSLKSREGQVLDIGKIICADGNRCNFLRHYLCFVALAKTIHHRGLANPLKRLFAQAVCLSYNSLIMKKGVSGSVCVEIRHDFEMEKYKRNLERELERRHVAFFAFLGPPPSNFY